jgi:predicted nucleotidyltransferase
MVVCHFTFEEFSDAVEKAASDKKTVRLAVAAVNKVKGKSGLPSKLVTALIGGEELHVFLYENTAQFHTILNKLKDLFKKQVVSEDGIVFKDLQNLEELIACLEKLKEKFTDIRLFRMQLRD